MLIMQSNNPRIKQLKILHTNLLFSTIRKKPRVDNFASSYFLKAELGHSTPFGRPSLCSSSDMPKSVTMGSEQPIDISKIYQYERPL